MIKFLDDAFRWTHVDRAVAWTKRHHGVMMLLLLLFAALILGQGQLNARDQAATARALAKSNREQTQRNKEQVLANRDAIERLIATRDRRRYALDVSRYHAALAGCKRQNVAREGTNRIIELLHTAFDPTARAEARGKKQTPLVHRLIVEVKAIHSLPITDCIDAVPNPALLDPLPKGTG